MKLNWKYLIFDIFKVALPLIALYFLPTEVVEGSLIDALLYGLSAVLGIDSVQKTARYVANGKNGK